MKNYKKKKSLEKKMNGNFTSASLIVWEWEAK